MITASTFRAHLKTAFVAGQGQDSISLQLVEVAEAAPSGGMLQFSVFFHGPADRPLSQGTYEFRHDALGTLLLFLVPIVGSNQQRLVYEACFSAPA